MSDTQERANEYIGISEYNEIQPQEIKDLSVVTVNDTVQTWISKLNQIIRINNLVMNNKDHPNENYPFYEFGFMSANDKVYLDEIRKKIKPETEGLKLFSSLVDTTNIKVSNSLSKIITNISAPQNGDNPSNVENIDIITINHDSQDVTRVRASGTLNIYMNGGSGTDLSGRELYSEKILSIFAVGNTYINYNTENTYRFVNNGIHPNLCVQYDNSTNSYKTSTFLIAENTLVLKIILIGDEILISIIDNTQLVDNYKDDDYHE